METRKGRKRKRRQENREQRESLNKSMETADENGHDESKEGNDDMEQEVVKISAEDILEQLKSVSSREATHANSGHRAGYDAFMTGFIFAVYKTTKPENISLWKNKLYLTGKDYPLTVSKSGFVKQSQQHLAKIAQIRKQTL